MKIATKAAAVDRRTAQKERKRKMIFPIVPSISKGNTTGETFFSPTTARVISWLWI
ncbi:hypothetical protein [Acetivibrio saccincola]|uniref:Uncharacterized protein n=1 Tax=Acetivibrio saccincola TaxID=1677857 RepID=A0A2K9EL36_9FIRM|nr:hypothetical protein [Acetivibrio saccincola]AUG58733.1 hypothetical protein HVS_14360 [Acetivibrio saccincola]